MINDINKKLDGKFIIKKLINFSFLKQFVLPEKILKNSRG